MREERAARRLQAGAARLQVELADPSGRLVFEARHVGKSFGPEPLIRDFSARVMRGDRIGLIGPNGSGKTTLLKLLLGEIAPDSGTVVRGANVQIAYYDQQREQLDPEKTVFDSIGEGYDTVTVNGRTATWPTSSFRPSGRARRSRLSREANATASCWPGSSRARPTSSFWTSRRTISTSRHSNGSRRSCWNSREPSCWSATTACSSTTP
jgi:ABC-type dipeptide/oligopeptide/nickel transport system ATPase subunit